MLNVEFMWWLLFKTLIYISSACECDIGLEFVAYIVSGLLRAAGEETVIIKPF